MATRNMAASFNPSNDRLLGSKTYQGATNIANAYDDSYAEKLYDAPIEYNRDTADFGQNEQKPVNIIKKSGTDRAANLLEGIQGKSKRPQSSNLGRQMSMQVNNQKSDNNLFHSALKDKNKGSKAKVLEDRI
jgi:hypothetical protein